MSTDIEKPQPYDPNAAVEAIRTKIRGAMLDVIPDEQWNAMIKAEMASFMSDRVERSQWGHETRYEAGFKKIVRELLEQNASERVKALLETPEWRANWGSGDEETGDAIRKYITENAGKILERWVGSAVQQVVNQMAYVQVQR